MGCLGLWVATQVQRGADLVVPTTDGRSRSPAGVWMGTAGAQPRSPLVVHPSLMEETMPGLRAPEDILATELKEIYSAERQLTRAMQRMMKKVSSERLREMLEQRM